jgi:hypothetical protein
MKQPVHVKVTQSTRTVTVVSGKWVFVESKQQEKTNDDGKR